jgi:hypothetical protein
MDVEPFSDNWTYLRTELNWLDRMLAIAIARQRKDTKEVDRVARSRADQVTSHWWKGLIVMDGEIASDSPADLPKGRSAGAKNYQQQMDARIRVSQQRGIALGLPNLCEQLHLTTFEKNLVLIALAPEMSQRYGRIYNFLQEADQSNGVGLPTVDLILRLLCRSDVEWRKARLLLSQQSLLIQHQMIHLAFSSTESFLANPVKLTNSLVEYLLAESPDGMKLERLIHSATPSLEVPPSLEDKSAAIAQLAWAAAGSETLPELLLPATPNEHRLLHVEPIATGAIAQSWERLVLPDRLLTTLRHLSNRILFADALNDRWGSQPLSKMHQSPGTIACLVGASGTGKTTAGHAISHTVDALFYWVDLALLSPPEFSLLLREIAIQAPVVLMLKCAQQWFGHSPTLSAEQVHQFLKTRQQFQGITLLSVERKELITPLWQKQMNQILEFPLPNQISRLRLWQQVFPAQVSLEADIDWQLLAQPKLSGGEILAIARDANVCALAESPDTPVGMRHLRQAITLSGKHSAKRRINQD